MRKCVLGPTLFLPFLYHLPYFSILFIYYYLFSEPQGKKFLRFSTKCLGFYSLIFFSFSYCVYPGKYNDLRVENLYQKLCRILFRSQLHLTSTNYQEEDMKTCRFIHLNPSHPQCLLLRVHTLSVATSRQHSQLH